MILTGNLEPFDTVFSRYLDRKQVLCTVYFTLATRNRLYLLLFKNGKQTEKKEHIITV